MFWKVPLVILLSFLLFPSYPLYLRISALDFCSHLIFMYFWTNTSLPWRASYRNTINFNPAVSLCSQTFFVCHFCVHGLLFKLLVYVGAQQ